MILKRDPTETPDKRIWSDLFVKSDFFNKYKHFIVLSATADEPEAYKKWFIMFIEMLTGWIYSLSRTGLVETNIRKLVNDLERNEFILIAHVNTEAVELPPEPEGNRYTSLSLVNGVSPTVLHRRPSSRMSILRAYMIIVRLVGQNLLYY